MIMDAFKIVEGYIPFFPGFYESAFENGDTEYCAVNEAIEDYLDTYGVEMSEDDFQFDYESRREDIFNAFCNVFKEYACRFEFVTDVNPLMVVSPTYYNYSTDHADAEIGLAENWADSMKSYINKYRSDLEKLIKDNHSSYDGFISFMSNRLETWETIIFNSDKIDMLLDKYGKYSDEYVDALKAEFPNVSAWDIRDNYHEGDADKYIIHMLCYIMSLDYNNSNNRRSSNLSDAIIINTIEDIYDGSYLSLSESGKEKIADKKCYYAK